MSLYFVKHENLRQIRITSVHFQSSNIDFMCIKGEGGQAYNFFKFDFEIWDEEELFRVVFGPCAQCCPCEASGENGAKNQNEIELWNCHYSICLEKTSNLNKNVKMRWKITELCQLEGRALK